MKFISSFVCFFAASQICTQVLISLKKNDSVFLISLLITLGLFMLGLSVVGVFIDILKNKKP